MNRQVASVFLVVIAIVGFCVYEISHKKKIETISENKPALVLDTVEEPVIGNDLLGRAQVSFAGGTEERNKNIEMGVARINGKVVMPGEEFSFTKALGPVTEEDGFSEAKVFLNGEVTKGLGGGLCQVSTTLFQSLLKSGLPITERHNHSYTVSYYDVGMDATYSDPGPDLKFVNDTTKPIIIKGKTEDKKVVFEIFGTYDGRIASTSEAVISDIVDVPAPRYVATTTRAESEPDCINTPQIGYTAKVTYEVVYASGTTKEQTFDSTYKPLQRVCYYYGVATTSISAFAFKGKLNN